MLRHTVLTSVATALLVASSVPAHAGIITNIGSTSLPGFSTGSLGPVGNTPFPNNDDTATPNSITFNIFRNSGGLGPADYEFVVGNSGGITEYLFVGAAINNTGTPWSHYTFELGFGTGANFVRSTTLDLLDFDFPGGTPTPTSGQFPQLWHASDLLQWSGATINPLLGGGPSPFTASFALRVDVPDDLALLNPSGLNRFTLRHTAGTGAVPTVPEPATMTLLGSGLLLSGVIARRRRRS